VVITAIASLFVTIHYGRQPHEVDIIADRITRTDATIAAGKAAAQATANTFAAMSFELEHRAAIIARLDTPDEIAVGDNLFTLWVRNNGKGDAVGVTRLRFGDTLTWKRERPTYPTANESASEMDTMIPGDERYYPFHIRLDAEQIDNINNKHPGQQLIVYVTLRYWDGFRCRRFNFCGAYRPKTECPAVGCGPGIRPGCTCDFPIQEQEEDALERCGHQPPTPPAKPSPWTLPH
jgi:hypothetical protein